MRTLADIEAELRAASYEAEKMRGIVSALTKERDEIRKCRELAVIEDFHAGMGLRNIAAKHAMPKNTVGSILHRNKLHYRKKVVPISHLQPDQQRLYVKAKRCGLSSNAARALVQA